MRAGRFPALTVAAVSLLSIMAKDKGNFLRLEILNKQPALMNAASIKFRIFTVMYSGAKIDPLNNTICWPV